MAWTAPKVDWDPPDIVANTDLNEIGENLLVLKAHADATSGVHGGASIATPSTFMVRDAAGRAQVVAPNADEDIARLDTVTAHTDVVTGNPHQVTAENLALDQLTNEQQMPLAGGTFAGKAYAQTNTDYTTAQIRSIKLMTSIPGVGDLENGQIAMVYEV